MQDLSIIIVNYNTKDLLKNCLDSIFPFSKNLSFEVIIVDNNSSDGSQSLIRSKFPQVKLITNKKNIGFARANNQGAKIAQGGMLMFLNSDTLFTPKTKIENLVGFLKTHKKAGIVSPLLRLKNGQIQPTQISYDFSLWRMIADKLVKFSALFFKRNCSFRKLAAKINLDFWDFNKLRKVDTVVAAAMLIKKKVFRKLGGFDENFFVFLEDSDLCLRTRKLGYDVYFNPSSEIIHLWGQSIKRDKTRKRFYYQSQNLYFKKHKGILERILFRIIRLPYKILKLC